MSLIIKSYYQSYPSYPNGVILKPTNLLFSDVYQTITANPVITMLNGVLSLPQSGYTFPQKIYTIKNFDVIAYAAGQTGIYTVNLSAETNVAPGNVYKLQIISGDGTFNETATVFSTGSTTNQLSLDLYASLLGMTTTGVFTATVNSATSTVTINEVNASTQGFTLIWSDTLAVITTTQANIAPTGSLAQAQAYNPNTSAGTYTICRWTLSVPQAQDMINGQTTGNLVFIDILLNSSAAGYATALAEIESYGAGFPAMPSTYSASFLANLVGTGA